MRQQCLTIGLGNTRFNLGLFYSIDEVKMRVHFHSLAYAVATSLVFGKRCQKPFLQVACVTCIAARLTALPFASHIPGYILCARRHGEMSSRILNGPTCIISVKREAVENRLNLFLMGHAHTKTSVHPLCLLQIQEHHIYRSA